MGKVMGGKLKRESIHVYLRLIQVEFDRKQNSRKELFFNKKKLINLKNI